VRSPYDILPPRGLEVNARHGPLEARRSIVDKEDVMAKSKSKSLASKKLSKVKPLAMKK
jgi:hypothetical protein